MKKNCAIFEGVILAVSIFGALIKFVISLFGCALIIWLGASVIEVTTNNTNPDYEYSEYNAFVMFSELLEK